MILLIRAQKDDISRYQTLINMQVNGRQISSENIYDFKNPYLSAYRSEKEKIEQLHQLYYLKEQKMYIIIFLEFNSNPTIPLFNIKSKIK